MIRLLLVLTAAGLLAGCTNKQSALDAHGASASALKDLIVFVTAICLIIWLLVVGFLGWSLLRRNNDIRRDAQAERRMTQAVVAAIGATALVVLVLTLASFFTTRSISSEGDVALTVRVKGQQWWWQFSYEHADQERNFQTANELHVPVGKDVRLILESIDVIHSLWIPSLAGKQDMIPGRLNVLRIRADREGVYRGQCAEFCGLQHSHMAFMVVAENEEDFQRWEKNQRKTATEPPNAEAAAGKAVFISKQCAACHTVRGTSAGGTSGPDLTHVGSRRTIGAGLLETTRGSLAAWIADPQTLKPGNNMPIVPLTSDELRDVSAYMESLR